MTDPSPPSSDARGSSADPTDVASPEHPSALDSPAGFGNLDDVPAPLASGDSAGGEGEDAPSAAWGAMLQEGEFPRTLCGTPAAPLPGGAPGPRVSRAAREWGTALAALGLVVGGIALWEGHRRPPACGHAEVLAQVEPILAEHLPVTGAGPGATGRVLWQAEDRARVCAIDVPTAHGLERVQYRVRWAPEGDRQPLVEPFEMLPGCGAESVLNLARARAMALDQAAGHAHGVRHLQDARQVGWNAERQERLCEVTVTDRSGDRTLSFSLSRLEEHPGQFRLRGTFADRP